MSTSSRKLHFQEENLKIIEVDEGFKFGPSGPYTCSKKIKIPIGSARKPLWFTVAIVDAKIPMLLGNNILKPHEAEIKLYSTGGGVLVLKDEEMALVETDAGHYTIKVSDLGKLCKMPECFECKLCDSEFSTKDSLKTHMGSQHEESVDRVSSFECKLCGKMYKSSTGRSIHMERKHGALDMVLYQTYSCEKCEDIFKSKSGLKYHLDAKHVNCKTLKSANLQ